MALRKNNLRAVFGKAAEWPLYLIIFALPFSKSLVEIMIVIAMIALVAKKSLARERIFENTPVNILLCLFVAAALPSFFNTPNLALSARALFSKLLKFAALFVIAEEAMDTKEKINNFLTMALISCVFIVTDAFIQYFVTHIDILHFPGYPSFQFSHPALITPRVWSAPYPDGFKGFPTASFPYPNDFAAWIIVFIFPVAAILFFKKEDWPKRLGLGLLCASLFYFLILTKTRGAWLGFVIALFFLFFLRTVNLKKFVLIVLALALLMPFVFKKSTIPYISAGAGISERNIMWANGRAILKQHPVIGNGLNTFFTEYKKVRTDEYKNKRGSYAHNCYLQMAAETGLLGLATFLLFLSALIVKAAGSLKSIKEPFYNLLILGLTLGLIAFLVHSAVDTNLYSLNLAALFWLSAGFLMAVVKRAESDLL
ncbi:MAG: O-antigen ligase family protein [Candidatus Omnitrophota bacterium]|nr:O-antigen ligase family protein [Candidatus Omnitrophota bacterium]